MDVARLAVLLLSLVQCAWSQIFTQDTRGCLSPRGQFPHELYCDKYYNCWDDNVFIEQCPNRLLFNPTQKYCDWPEKVSCGSRKLRSADDSKLCPRQHGTFSYPYNCGWFVECVFGRPVVKQCAPGTLFNPIIPACDHAGNVNCQTRGGEGNAWIQPKPAGSDGKLEFRCPSIRGLFPYAKECSKFWLCRNNYAVLLECPPNQLFDVKGNSCVLAGRATCFS